MQFQQHTTRAFLLSLLISVSGVMSGCASIVHSGSRNITINTQPSGAKVTVTKSGTSDVVHSGATPLTAVLDPKRGYFKGQTYLVRLELPGYETDEVLIKPELSGWYLGNVLFGGLIGMIAVDPATGSMWNLIPEKLDRTLAPRQGSIATANSVPPPSAPVRPPPRTVADSSDSISATVATPPIAPPEPPRLPNAVSDSNPPPDRAPRPATVSSLQAAAVAKQHSATPSRELAAKASVPVEKPSSLGLMVYVLSGQIWVKAVGPKSAAAQAGIREGDTIVSFNSEKYSGDGFALLRKIHALNESAMGMANITWRRGTTLENLSRRVNWSRE